jgi:preprotein translocase subunit SecD
VAPSAGTLRVGRYFAVLLGLFVLLYAVVAWPHQPKTPKLGLDLQGGAQVILTAQTDNHKAPSKSSMDQARQIITDRVNGLGVSSAEVVTEGNDRIVVSVPGASANDIKGVGGTAFLQFRPLLVASTPVTAASSSTSASPSATASAKASGTAKASSTAKSTAKASSTAKATTSPSAHGRVVPLAAGSASATPTGSATPLVSPSASGTAKPSGSASASPSASSTVDPSAPIDQWKIVGITWCQDGKTTPAGCIQPTPAAVAALPSAQQQQLTAAVGSWPCNNVTKPVDNPKLPIITCDQANANRYLLGPVIVAGTQVKSAAAVPPGAVQGQFEWTVTVDLKPQGQAAWASYTSKHNVTVSPSDIGNQVADTLDSKVIVASTIQSTITGTTQITGSFTGDQATSLANSLKYGALPLSFKQDTASTISPTLGTDQLKAGLLAGGIGLALVVLYSLIYYRALGLVTIASLLVSGGLTYAMLVILGHQIGFTLTLAGIAGFIVAVGITADSFVVFFERIKDEVHEGRTARTAIPRAWERSRRTILSADTVSFLAAATLYYFAAGDVKGFAFTLGLSTIIDLVVVFLFTHPLVSLFSRSAAFGSAKFTGLDHVRSGGIATRDQSGLKNPELVTAGVGSVAAEPAAEPRVTGGPVMNKRARVAPPVPSTEAEAFGATPAERAAARRAANREQSDNSSKDKS